MSDTEPASTPPAPQPDVHSRRHQPSIVNTPLRTLALCFASFVVMAPWPILGILLMRSLFDEPAEAFGLFGGMTLFPLMILVLFGPVEDHVFYTLIMFVWFAAPVLSTLWFRRKLRTHLAIGGFIAAHAAFSFCQAAMGALLIIGKSV